MNRRLLYRFLYAVIMLQCFGSPRLFAQSGNVEGQVLTIEQHDTIPMPGVHVIVYQLDNTLKTNKRIVAGATDSVGHYSFSLLQSPQAYTFHFSSIGYKTREISVSVTQANQSCAPIIMHEDTILLNEVRVEQSLKGQSAENRKYIFTARQRKMSINALQMVAKLPGLRLDRATNRLTPITGGDVMILINGLPASAGAVRALSPKNVKRAIVYDVPPAEYHASGYLVNLIVDYPDSSISGDINLTAGNLYSSFDPVLNYVSKRHMWTIELSSHLNPKNRFDYYKGTETYTTPGEQSTFNMEKKEQTHNLSLLPSLSYLYNGDKVRVIAKIATGLYNEQEVSSSTYTHLTTTGSIQQQLNNKVKNRSAEADLYLQYNLPDKSNILFSSNFSLNNNRQELHSQTNNSKPNLQDLKIERTGFVNELVYRNDNNAVKYTSGIRSSFLHTHYNDTNAPYYSKRFLNTLYGELWGDYNAWAYRGSLFLNHENNQTPVKAYQEFNFTPQWLISYTFNPAVLLRYSGNVSARRPSSQELSNVNFKISPLMYKAGNPYLRNEFDYENELLLRVTQNQWQLDWSLLANNQINPIVVSYEMADIDGSQQIVRRPINEKSISRYETSIYFSLAMLNESLNFNLDTRLAYFSLQRAKTGRSFNMWLPRLAASLSYQYKAWSFEYYQILFGKEISDLLISDLEKVSYINVGYRRGNLGIYASLFFPFGQNAVNVKSIQNEPFHSDYRYRMRSKERTISITLSWFFGDIGKQLNNSKELNNSDNNRGILNIK